jgi:hypothetical protein
MRDDPEARIAKLGVWLIDAAYMAWFEAESEAEVLLRAWFLAKGEQREVVYLAYRAALDREEAAARDLERMWFLASTCDAVVAERAFD